ncbi:glycosyltransferase family 4 protein [Algibacter sp. L4_22]|uniref:glycosyltransferase family 4 protein n=1 Tax=Algibacter sp. L4_22 TaxID=2942477 RepID=UPI00201B6436|nr:glycosyltransferase family 4 protein [Algibacter sp. L4_22]MCL5127856.1 glycosyltransferase family 4 protein [Algibacter sp. L4_22]
MLSKIKLLYITNQICGAAGLERVLSIKARLLAENYDYKLHIITLNQGNVELFYDFGNKITYHDISVSGNPMAYVKQYIKNIKNKVNSIKPDIICVCDDGLKGFFLPLILNKPCPMVYERHVSKKIENTTDSFNILKWLKNKLTFKLMYWAGKKYDKFVVLTEGNLKEWPLKNTMVINNPLSFNINVPKSNLDKKIVLAVGRQSYQKGYDRLLLIWQKVIKDHPDWELHIYGKSNTSLELEKTAQIYDINSSVKFFDPVKNISQVYQKASIFVLSSRFEGFGMVLTEAMIHGVPCISFDCPYGPSDIINHDKNGFLIQNGNIEDFADTISKLIKNNNLRYTMGNQALNKALKFSPDIIIEQWNSLFKLLLS